MFVGLTYTLSLKECIDNLDFAKMNLDKQFFVDFVCDVLRQAFGEFLLHLFVTVLLLDTEGVFLFMSASVFWITSAAGLNMGINI